MGLTDTFRGWLWDFLLPDETMDDAQRRRIKEYERYRDYYEGQHKRQLKHKPMQADDNLVENYLGLVVERSISMLLGDGVQFELPDDSTQELITEVMKANRSNIKFYEAAQNAAIYGTGFVKLSPGSVESKDRENVMLTRIIVLDPRWMRIVTPPEDIDIVSAYEMRYNVGDTARREVTENIGGAWEITNYVANRSTKGQWEPTGPSVIWEYEFPPIVHWKNLPQANDCYGRSELSDVIEIQDRINFVSSNILKILRYHAHPKTWGTGTGLGQNASWGADEIVMVNGEGAKLANLEMQTDLGSSREFRNDLKTALFEISRTVDPTGMKDKVGQLTNFGLRVLYNDTIDKNSTKRDLFGEALLETIHRILALEGAASTDPGKIIWSNPLPSEETEQNQIDGFDLDHGLVSQETIATRRGYDWEREQERIQAERETEDNLGAALLRAFNRGQ